MLEKTLESPLDCKDIQPVHPKGDQSWVFIGRTDAEAETPIFWPPDAKSWLIWKDPDVGKDWRWEEKEMTEDEMVRWHHWLNGHEFEQAPGTGDGQGGLACCGSWGRIESDTTERLNWTEYGPDNSSKSHSAKSSELNTFYKYSLDILLEARGSTKPNSNLTGRNYFFKWERWELLEDGNHSTADTKREQSTVR